MVQEEVHKDKEWKEISQEHNKHIDQTNPMQNLQNHSVKAVYLILNRQILYFSLLITSKSKSLSTKMII